MLIILHFDASIQQKNSSCEIRPVPVRVVQIGYISDPFQIRTTLIRISSPRTYSRHRLHEQIRFSDVKRI